ncbi:outer membrane beta-barrel protein [unidentified bacterial endosymbiont]|uniref:outer membrane beta-barrel protein n=1 Tax=unidentified bacterial endosymbiont TaxID=2355 RepID=UPI0020A11D4A|nr:outer membrane beta-barrel protein [unidentified bacterial endosymbiont]
MSTQYYMPGKLSCLTLLALLPLISSAQAASDGLYAGANVGWSQFDSNEFTRGNYRDSIGYGGFVGYQFSPWFSLEGGGSSLGSAHGDNGASMDVQGLNLSGKFTYSWSGMSLYSRLGGMWYRSDVSNNDINKSEVGTGVAPLAALGLEHSWNSNITSRLEYQWTGDIKNDAATSATLNNGYLSVGFTWHFGNSDDAVVPVTVHPAAPATTLEAVTVPVKGELAILYPFNEYKLSKDNQRKILDYYNPVTSDPSTKIDINGYSDTQGSDKNNYFISEQRANSVKEFLISNGANHENITLHALGSTSRFSHVDADKMGPTENTDDYSLNRRVTIKAY